MTNKVPINQFIIILLGALIILVVYVGVQSLADSSGDFTNAIKNNANINNANTIDDENDIDILLDAEFRSELSACIEDYSCIEDENSGTIEPSYINPTILIIAWCNDYCNGNYPGMYNERCKEKCPTKVAEELRKLRDIR